ncbi:PAS domain-containing sensor histidine kinase [Sphingobacterium sp. SYP-B4668]|uniref:PAS domain-containing sensor histidine kinase n=1 Tax=Sphingobacterium sp. SYP-B4668 TaxID=2996035 RepID=UPI0022DDF863|nr:HAMP domain-containing sensor histidine kinase [Sphingobacterium sp. SYP-B4668]
MTQAALQSLVESSSLLFFTYDPYLEKFTYLNPAFRSFFELKASTLTLEAFLVMVHPEDRNYLVERLEEIEEESVDGVECRFQLQSGEGILRISAYPIVEEGKKLLVGHAEDVTITKEYNLTITKHNAKKNAILNILSHDLAGPIGVIGNLAEVIKLTSADGGNTKLLSQIDSIHEISKSCIQLIQDFLNQEFLQSVSVPLVRRRIDFVKRMHHFATQYRAAQEELGVQFTCTSNTDVIYIDIDEDKFMQVVNNLISNALKFTPNGGTISLYIEEKETSVILTVADNGIGIPEEHHKDLFEKFSRARRKGLRGEYSTGLGMWIIKTIIEWHGGRIWFESEVDRGTTFYIELPKH